jgi:hypothetical protein
MFCLLGLYKLSSSSIRTSPILLLIKILQNLPCVCCSACQVLATLFLCHECSSNVDWNRDCKKRRSFKTTIQLFALGNDVRIEISCCHGICDLGRTHQTSTLDEVPLVRTAVNFIEDCISSVKARQVRFITLSGSCGVPGPWVLLALRDDIRIEISCCHGVHIFRTSISDAGWALIISY